MATLEELTALIAAKGDDIRTAKANNIPKEEISSLVNELLALKEKYKELNGGVAYDPPKPETVKKAKAVDPPPAEPVAREGPSKKELNKLARKEKSAALKESKKAEKDNSEVTTGGPPAVHVNEVSSAASVPVPSSTSSVSASITYSKGYIPELTRMVASLLNSDIYFTASSSADEHLPYLTVNAEAGTISGDLNIVRYLVRLAGSQGAALYGNNDPCLSSQIDEWLDVFIDNKYYHLFTKPETLVDTLNTHLETRTYLVGYHLSIADVALVLALKKGDFNPTSTTATYVGRWFQLVSSQLPYPKPLTSSASKPKPAAITASAASPSVDANSTGEEGTCPPLEDAIDGQVCTRFPPEPSGYLHIGHCKAVLLNQYYAQRYHGKLIVRFDDTNPSKEKEEYEENIIKDLETLHVKADKVSHTSDHFDVCIEMAKKLIADGNGYMDDTDQETMQKERMDLKESKHRNTSAAENLALFDLLLKGDANASKYCLRAKIDMSSVNGTMRDPVMFRYNDTPHHRTGTKYKAYPTYDFACPIVDAIEGVTHALRTTEYNDRDEQYHWIQRALNLRDVKIMTYGKVNFVNTVLSKRKLNWFVEQGLVEGWFDPRFPTIQGCVRRGMNVEALKHFILSQGASRRVITMEWDKFWSENKKLLEEICPRYMAVNDDQKVKVIIDNVDDKVTGHTVQVHPQKPEHGTRVMRRGKYLWLDQIDAKMVKVDEDVTLLRWGNIKIKSIEVDPSTNVIVSIHTDYDAGATNFSKTKKLTWLAAVDDVVPITIVEFDHLISKAKLGEEDNFKDYINPKSRWEYLALGDPMIRTLPSGSVIQLERKGFFRVDKAYTSSSGKSAVLFAIPDGKVQKPASK